MKQVILYVLFVVLAVTATAKPFKVANVATVGHTKTDTIKGTQTFDLSYKGDMDTVVAFFEGTVGFAKLDTAFVTYFTQNGNVVSTDIITSFTSYGTKTKAAVIKIDKQFPAAVSTRVLLKYTLQGITSGKIYYIIY